MNKAILFFLVFNVVLFAENLKPITLQLSWKNQFQFAGYLIAKHKGYYEQVGLDVTIKEFDNKINLPNSVLNNNAQFAIGRTSIIMDKLKGAQIVAIAAINSESPLVLIALKSSKINDIEDLKNKKIMITGDAKESANISAMLNSNAISSKDFIRLEHSFDINDLLNSKADAMACYSTNEPYVLKQKKIEYIVFDPKDYGFEFYDDFLFTSNEFAKQNPKIVNDFYEASLKGWRDAFANVNTTAKIIFDNYNSQNKSLGHLIFEGNELKKASPAKNFGGIKKAKLEKIINTFHVLGVENKKFNIDEFYDSFTIKTINAKYENLNDEIIYESIDYELIAKIIGFFGLVLIVVSVWNARLKKEIAKRKEIEAKLVAAKILADEANFAKTKLVATIAHDIKTPMNMVLGYLTMLSKTELSPKQTEYCDKILKGSQTLLSFVDDIVDFGKIESNKFQLNLNRKSIQKLLAELENTFSYLANAKQLEFEIVDNTPQIPLFFDDRKLYKILSNLLSNAVKYTNSGFVRLEVSIYKKIENFVQLEFVIIDSGIGISNDDSTHIFTIFERGTKPSKELGDGLGLFIVKQLIDGLHWEISFESDKNGTRFKILTSFLAFDENNQKEISQNIQEIKHYESKSVLIVDDNEQNLEVLEEMLRLFGVKIAKAQDGRQALRLALQEEFDLVITDILMPISDGVQLASKLRQNGFKIPIVAASADFDIPNAGAKFDDFLEKPIEFEKLQKTLEKFFY